MSKLQEMLNVMVERKWVIEKDVIPCANSKLSEIKVARPILGIAEAYVNKDSDNISMFLVSHQTWVNKHQYCFVDVTLDKEKRLIFNASYVVRASNILSALTLFNEMYSDAFVNIPPIQYFHTRYNDIMKIGEDDTDFDIYYDPNSNNITNVSKCLDNFDWTIHIHPIFSNLNIDEIPNDISAVCEVANGNFLVITDIDTIYDNKVYGVLFVTPYGYVIDGEIIKIKHPISIVDQVREFNERQDDENNYIIKLIIKDGERNIINCKTI